VHAWFAAQPKTVFWGHKEACAKEQVQWRARGLCWKIML
jgi:hypothetical protein